MAAIAANRKGHSENMIAMWAPGLAVMADKRRTSNVHMLTDSILELEVVPQDHISHRMGQVIIDQHRPAVLRRFWEHWPRFPSSRRDQQSGLMVMLEGRL